MQLSLFQRRFVAKIFTIASLCLLMGCAQGVSMSQADANAANSSGKTDDSNPTLGPVPTPGAAKADYSYLDPKHVIPAKALQQAVNYFDLYKSQFSNQDWIVIVDFTKYSAERRFHLVNMKTGEVSSYRVAHGIGSDPNMTGYAKKFSNVSGSNASSIGFYRTLASYEGAYGYSLRIQGLSSTNSEVLDRAIVIHGIWFVYDDKADRKSGYTQGCFGLAESVIEQVVDKIKGGTLMYAWAN